MFVGRETSQALALPVCANSEPSTGCGWVSRPVWVGVGVGWGMVLAGVWVSSDAPASGRGCVARSLASSSVWLVT
jgi:hypothetical protein